MDKISIFIYSHQFLDITTKKTRLKTLEERNCLSLLRLEVKAEALSEIGQV